MHLITCINKHATWKKIIFLFCTSTVLGTLIITMFFNQIKLEPNAAMDSLTFYTSDTFFRNLDIQGETGRHAYLQLHLIDYIFISQFYLLFVFLINFIIRKINSKKIAFFCLIPFLSAGMDLLENIFIDISIVLYPQKIIWFGKLSGIFTLIKMYSIYVTLLLIVILLFLFVIKTVINGNSKT